MEIGLPPPTVCLPMDDASRVGECRRLVARFAEELEFSDEESGRAALVATEVATNLCKHAQGGELLLRMILDQHQSGMEFLSVDRGPGIDRLGECLRDGFSTSGTPGKGLGCIVRQSDLFDVHTAPSLGTVLACRVMAAPTRQPVSRAEAGVICRPVYGEHVCGDSWNICDQKGRARIVVVDGLGHGLLAHEASKEAIRITQEYPQADLVELMQRADGALRSTRGAAMLAVDVYPQEERLECLGTGNVAGQVVNGRERKSLISLPGTVGMNCRKFQTFQFSWKPASTLILHSDGLSANWNLDQYPGLAEHRPSVIAGVLYRQYGRARDDATVLVVRGQEAT